MGEHARGKLVLLMGPSGVGKSVILRQLRQRNPALLFPRSATTRARRPGEGDDLYVFLMDAEFDSLIREGKLLEWARVHGGPPDPDGIVRAGARYGTLLEEIIPRIEEGKTVVREVDVQGFESIRAHPLFSGDHPSYVLQSIFILPENTEQLIERIRRRAPITEEELRSRIASVERELAYARLCDVRVVNREGDIAATVAAVERAVLLP